MFIYSVKFFIYIFIFFHMFVCMYVYWAVVFITSTLLVGINI